jgi:hypothetical protein
LSSAATVQNWTPRCRRTREVCDFLNTSSGHAISTHNQPNLESTRAQPSFFCLKFWALVSKLFSSCLFYSRFFFLIFLPFCIYLFLLSFQNRLNYIEFVHLCLMIQFFPIFPLYLSILSQLVSELFSSCFLFD